MVVVKTEWLGNEEEVKSVRKSLVMASPGNFTLTRNDDSSSAEWKQSQCNNRGSLPQDSARIVLHCQPNSHPFQTRTIFLEPNTEIKVGRSIARNRVSENNAIFDCKVLSRNHAVLWYNDGKFFVKDTKSSNGTFINDRRIDQSEAELLSSGDIVKFGVDVIENSRKEVHGCIIACVKLFTPDGKEVISNEQSRNNFGDGFISLDEMHRLQHFIQEASQREKLLEVKLHDVQTIIEETRKNTSSWWQAMIDEDKLLNRIDSLESKLHILQKNASEDRLRNEILKLQDDKCVYQNSAKEALRRVYQERMDALHKLSTIERALCNSEDECSLLRDQLLRTQQSLKEVNCRLTQLETECKERKHWNEESSDLRTEESEPLNAQLKIKDEECQEYKSKVNELLIENNSLQKQLEYYDKLRSDQSDNSLWRKNTPAIKSTILKWLENSDLKQKEGSNEIIQAICNELETNEVNSPINKDYEEICDKLNKVQKQISYLESGTLNDDYRDDVNLISSSSLSDGNQNIEVMCESKDLMKCCASALVDIYKDMSTYIAGIKQNYEEMTYTKTNYNELGEKLKSVEEELAVLKLELQSRPSLLQIQEKVDLNEELQIEINSLKGKLVEFESCINTLTNDKLILEKQLKNITVKESKEIGLQTVFDDWFNLSNDEEKPVNVKGDLEILNNSVIQQEEELVAFKERYEILTKENIELRNNVITLKCEIRNLQSKFLMKFFTYGMLFIACFSYLLLYHI